MMKKQILLLTLLLSVAASAFAVEAEIDGLWYELISKAKEATVIRYKNNIKYSGNIVIPETVEYNGANYSVTRIGERAFYNCSGLTSITIPNSVTSIGAYAFYNCSSLTSVTIPNGVTSIGNGAFEDCKYLTSVTIGNSVMSIGAYAFNGCSYLTSITIPNSVTSIGNGAFSGCFGLTSVHISDIAAWCNIAFSDNPLLYAHHLYLGGEEITDLVIPNSVTSIGYGAFYNCKGLTSVTIPNSVTSIGGSAFQYCSGLTSVTIGNSVTSIGDWAFSWCGSLTSVTIGNSVTSIGRYTFSGCSGLTSVHISDIAAWCKIAFSSYESNPLYKARHLYLGEEEITDLVIPNSVTSIGGYAFYNCSGLTSVTIGNSVTSIGEYNQEIKGVTNVEVIPVSA